jgi:hypothetical protein
MKTKTTTTRAAKAVITEVKPMPGKPAGTNRKPFICGAAERITDAVADILISGSALINLQRLIDATISHEVRLRCSTFTPKELEETITKRQEKSLPGILKELADSRTKRLELDKAERPEPADIVGRIREGARHQCARGLQEFLSEGSPEEIRFMSAVMLNWTSAYNQSEPFGEFGIANSFQDELTQGIEYIRVPAVISREVGEYIDALMKAYPEAEKEAA